MTSTMLIACRTKYWNQKTCLFTYNAKSNLLFMQVIFLTQTEVCYQNRLIQLAVSYRSRFSLLWKCIRLQIINISMDCWSSKLTCITIIKRSNWIQSHLMNAAIRFLLYGFTYYLTLSSECFSTFPHGTCSLSVSL